MPSTSTHTIYTSKNAAPPLPCVSAGNRQTLPKPIADPTVAATNPILVANFAFPSIIYICPFYCFVLPKCSSQIVLFCKVTNNNAKTQFIALIIIKQCQNVSNRKQKPGIVSFTSIHLTAIAFTTLYIFFAFHYSLELSNKIM